MLLRPVHVLLSLLVVTCAVAIQSGACASRFFRFSAAHQPSNRKLNPLLATEATTGPAFRHSDQLVFGPFDGNAKSGPPAGAQNDWEGGQAFFDIGPTIARKEVCFRDVYAQPGESSW